MEKNTSDTIYTPPVWLAVDLGGTTVKMALLHSPSAASDNGGLARPEPIARITIPTRTKDGGKQILPDIASAAQRLARQASLSLTEIDGMGIGVPGPVLEKDAAGYPVAGCVNLNWTGIWYPDADLREMTRIRRICVMNDANAAALGELFFGQDQHSDAPGSDVSEAPEAADTPVPAEAKAPADVSMADAVMVTLGTGIGGGIIHDGRIITGAFGAAGEIGHMPIRPGGDLMEKIYQSDPSIPLEAEGDLEYFASATGIARVTQAVRQAARAKADLWPSDAERSPLMSGPEPIAKDVFDAAKAGDALALCITDFFFDTLGRGLASIASVADPDLFIIGGGVAAAGDFLLEGLRTAYLKHVFHASRGTAFRLACLGNDAGLLGPLVPLMRE